MILKVYFYTEVPFFCDEAYFFNAGKLTFFNFYDHPGMILFFTHFVEMLGNNVFILRSPQFIMSTLISLTPLIFLLTNKKIDRGRAYLASSILLLSPVNILFIFMLNDSFLLFFSVFSIVFLYLALAKRKHYWVFLVLSGLCLGAAFFSKYIVFPTIVAVLYTLLFDRQMGVRKKASSLLLIFIVSLPFLVLNFAYNYEHDWSNLIVAFSPRRFYHGMGFGNILFAVLPIIFTCLLISPLNIPVFRSVRRWFQRPELGCKVFRNTVIIHLMFFGLWGLVGTKIGFYWLIPASVFLLIFFCFFFSGKELAKVLKNLFIFQCVLSLLLLYLLNAPLSELTVLPKKVYSQIVFIRHLNVFSNTLDQYRQRHFVVMATSFGNSGALSMGSGYAAIWGMGAYEGYGRQDDLVYNFKTIAHRNVVVFTDDGRCSPSDLKEYRPYFSKVLGNTVHVNHVNFCFVEGYNFNYPVYRDRVLHRILTTYYLNRERIKWLPYGRNFFYRKYWG